MMSMLPETIAVFSVALLLAGIGIGPALLFLRRSDPDRLPRALAVSPALGLCLVVLLSFPLLRYVAPVKAWAPPFTGALLVISGLLCFAAFRHSNFEAKRELRRVLPGAAVWFVSLGVLVLPFTLRGVPHAVFRANPGDAYVYLSQAQAVQDVSWKTYLDGALLAEKEGVRRLAEESPTALMTARTLLIPLALNRAATQAWAAQVSGVRAWRFYYPFHALILGVTAGMAMALAHLLGLRRVLIYLAGVAIGLGFWGQWVRESDAGYQLAATPLLLLSAFAWILAERGQAPALAPVRLLLGLAVAGVVALYAPFLQVLVLAGVVYYALGLLQRRTPLSSVLRHIGTAAAALLVLALTGQLDWLARNVVVVASNPASVFGGGQVFSAPLLIIERDGMAGVWGVPPATLFAGVAQKLLLPLRFICETLAVLLTAGAAGLGWSLVRRKGDPAPHLVMAFALSGALTMVLLVVTDRSAADVANFAAGKAFTFVYPFVMLLPLAYTRWMSEHLTASQQRVAFGAAVLWLTLQAGIGLWPLKRSHVPPFSFAGSAKVEQYDLSPIIRALDARPGSLLVYTPRRQRWLFETYVMFALAPYRPHFLSGLIIDNNVLTPNLWPSPLAETPDYALVLRTDDYIAPQRLGEQVAETRELILYRLHERDVAIHRQMGQQLEEKENSEPRKVPLTAQAGSRASAH